MIKNCIMNTIRKFGLTRLRKLLNWRFHCFPSCLDMVRKNTVLKMARSTATEYAGERQDMMQELNRQRQEAIRYIQDIVRAVLWFANTFQGGSWDIEAEVNVEFDDSYITNKEAELEQMRSDAVSFSDIPIFRIRYIMERLNCDEKQARAYLAEGQMDRIRG